jgi:hypothetical protein
MAFLSFTTLVGAFSCLLSPFDRHVPSTQTTNFFIVGFVDLGFDKVGKISFSGLRLKKVGVKLF